MKIYEIGSREVFEIDARKSGENAMPCPVCSQYRKKTKAKSFSFNVGKGTGQCFACEAKFVTYEKPKEKEFKVPESRNLTQLSDEHLKFFYSRKISQEALIAMGIKSSEEWMPQHGKKVGVVCFPYLKNGKLVNIKYRGPQKSFKLVKDAELILMNWDVVKDSKKLIIVEGEMDLLAYVTAGMKNVVSVPNGAQNNLDYLDGYMDQLEHIEEFYLGTDNDEKGRLLRDELLRRLGTERCKLVSYGAFKDAGEYLIEFGGLTLRDTIKDAQEAPMDGVFSWDDIEEEVRTIYLNGGLPPGMTIGDDRLDEKITWELGRLVTVTGIPGHGKSEFVDYITCRMNMMHGWKCGYFSPENHPLGYHVHKVTEKFIGRKLEAIGVSVAEYERAWGYIGKNFYFVSPPEDYTVDNVLAKAKDMVRRRGIKVFVIDPYNRMDHKIPSGYTETQYISEFLDKLTNFARINNVLVFLVAHPRKMDKTADGKWSIPNLYSISGSANFFNKTDYGLSVYREQDDDGLTSRVGVHIQKVKFRHLGHTGLVNYVFNKRNGRYEVPSLDIDAYQNNPNWLDVIEKAEQSKLAV